MTEIGPGGPQNIRPADALGKERIGKTEQGDSPSFKDILENSLDQVNQLQEEADAALDKVATGEVQNIDEVMMAAKKAEIAFKMMMEIRNKLVNAYDEVKRMQF